MNKVIKINNNPLIVILMGLMMSFVSCRDEDEIRINNDVPEGSLPVFENTADEFINLLDLNATSIIRGQMTLHTMLIN